MRQECFSPEQVKEIEINVREIYDAPDFPLFLSQIPSCPRVHLEISRQRTPVTLRLDGPETPFCIR